MKFLLLIVLLWIVSDDASAVPGSVRDSEGSRLKTENPELHTSLLSRCKHRNVALKGRATQSTIYTGYTGAINAIDGNMDSNYYHGSCSCTTSEKSPWWRVDLLRPYKISHIVITNRGDCCGERLIGAKLLVGNSLDNNGNNNPSCAEITCIPNGATVTFQCNNMVGQYVNVILPEKNTYLHLCEVQVFGVPESNEQLCL